MSVSDATLLRPEALWLILTVLPVTWLVMKKVRASGDWSRVIDAELLPHLLKGGVTKQARKNHWLVPVGLSIAILGIAGPSFEKIDVPVFQRADALVIVLDLSASMSAADIQPSRIQRARQKIMDILNRRSEGVTGLVVYAGDAHVVAPLTDDQRTIENLLPALDPAIMPLPGSNPKAALEAATGLLAAGGLASGRLLLITDGMPAFDADAIAPMLEIANAELAVLAVGTVAGAPIPRADGGFLRADDGEIVIPTLDSAELQNIARRLGGRYAEVALDNRDIDYLLTETAFDDQGEVQLDRKTDTWLDQGNWIALLLALGLLPLFRRGALSVLLTAPLLWSAPAEAQLAQHLWQTPDQQGAQAAAEGNHEKAATLFENSAWRGVSQYRAGQWTEATKSFEANDTANSWYNRGNSLAQAGQYENAIAAYDQSLNLQPDQADALKNRDIVRQLLEQQNQESEQDQQSENGSDNQEQQSDQQNKQSGDSEASDDQNDQQSPEDSNSSEDSNGSPDSSDSPQENSQSGEPSEQEQQGDEAPTELSDEQRERLAEQTRQQMGKFDEGLEKQQALEQWMRRVPDDPGGLLQRKFRYETIQRLRQGEEPDNEVRW